MKSFFFVILSIINISQIHSQIVFTNEYQIPFSINPPELLKPPFAMINVSLLPSFVWSNVKDANSYELQVSVDPIFFLVFLDIDNITDTHYQLSSNQHLLPLFIYYWRVRSKNKSGCGNYSSAFQFTTGL